MFSIKKRYKTARQRIESIRTSLPPDEAFLVTYFFVEKLIRRTLIQLMIRTGNTKDDALKEVKKLPGIWKLRAKWKTFDSTGRKLEDVLGAATWKSIREAIKLRNDLVHGSGNEGQSAYKKRLPSLIAALDEVKRRFEAEYGYWGWKGMRDSAGDKI